LKQKVNYFGQYNKLINQAEDIREFVQNGVIVNNSEITNLLKVQRKLGVAKSELKELQEKEKQLMLDIYSPELTHKNDNLYFQYHNKATDITYYYDNDGYEIDEEEYHDNGEPDKYLYPIKTKNSEGSLYLGYNIKRALAVYGYFKFKISADNSRISMNLQNYYVVNLLDADEKFCLNTDGEITTVFTSTLAASLDDEGMVSSVISEFSKEFYGVDYIPKVYSGDFYSTKETENFELVIKTAPKWFIDLYFKEYKFRGKFYNKVNHMSKMFGITKDVYNLYKDQPDLLIMAVYLVKEKGISKQEAEEIINKVVDITREFELFGKGMDTYGDYHWYINDKWFNLTKVMDRDFIHHSQHQWFVFYELVEGYFDERNKISNSYSLMQYLQYARDAIIDQGFNDVSSFVTEITDYIRFNYEDNSEPVVKPDYLRRVHDVYVANRKITVSEEENKAFMEKYKDAKEWTKKYTKKELAKFEEKDEEVPEIKYMITFPKKAEELKREGNVLNHCVGGYIPRVINGELLIYFLRRIDRPDEPFITVEVRDGKVTQARGATNRQANKEIKEYLDEWTMHLRLQDKKNKAVK
jgi:hypothetical protein